MKFGRLTIIVDMGMRQHGFSQRARHMVKCRCDCGQTLITRLSSLKLGHTQSCGCLNREQVAAAAKGINRSLVEIGKVYNHMTVLERMTNTPKGAAVYKVKCSCGNIRSVLGTSILSGGGGHRCRKCGYSEHLAKVHALLSKPSGEAACYAAFIITKRQCADKRGFAWKITLEDWKRLTRQPCHYCGEPPSNHSKGRYNGTYRYNGLDRVDNSVGYVLNNVVPCCKRCNCAKSDQTLAEFLNWVSRVHKHCLPIPL